MSCLFCEITKDRTKWIAETDNLFAIYDQYPVTEKHILIITKDHFVDFLELPPKIMSEICHLTSSLANMLQKDEKGLCFNMGTNCGKWAGQVIMHTHFHIIPRRKGDMDDPRGGIRGCIPDKRIYNAL